MVLLQQYARARVMGCYSETEEALGHDRKAFQRRRCASAIRARLAFVLGPVDIPPWNRQRRFPGTTLTMHGAPARVFAQHLGRNLRFKGSPLRDKPRSSNLRHQLRSRQIASEMSDFFQVLRIPFYFQCSHAKCGAAGPEFSRVRARRPRHPAKAFCQRIRNDP
jgi:hypothetical protein